MSRRPKDPRRSRHLGKNQQEGRGQRGRRRRASNQGSAAQLTRERWRSNWRRWRCIRGDNGSIGGSDSSIMGEKATSGWIMEERGNRLTEGNQGKDYMGWASSVFLLFFFFFLLHVVVWLVLRLIRRRLARLRRHLGVQAVFQRFISPYRLKNHRDGWVNSSI